MSKQISLTCLTRIVVIVGSLLAILVYFLPYVPQQTLSFYEEATEEEYESDWDYTTTETFEGFINDKYAIEMELNKLDGNLWGSYRYKKNDTWILLEGSRGEGTQVTLTEYVDDKCTGRFEGWYNESDIVGEWISAGEERRMPFKVELKSRQEP